MIARMTMNTQREVIQALRNTLTALEAHLNEEEKRTNVKRAALCPCEENEVREAKGLLRRLEAEGEL